MKEDRYLSLVMTFETSEGGTSTVTIKQVRDNIEMEDIQEVMGGIIATNIFDSTNGDLVKAVKGEIIDKVVESYDLREEA